MKNLVSIFTNLMKATLTLVLFFPLCVFAQFANSDWDTIPFPYITGGIESFVLDTSNSALFVFGAFIRDDSNTINGSYLLRYENGKVSPFANFNYTPSCAVYYEGSLIVGGGFSSVNGVGVSGIAKYNTASGWSSFGDFKSDQYIGTVWGLSVIDDTLYAVGGFNVIDGDSIDAVSRFVNGKWEAVYGSPFKGSLASGIIKYKNDLYVSGVNVVDNGTIYIGLAMYSGGSWKPVGPPYLSGGFTHIKKMTVFENELYVLGWIQKSDGNVGNGIQKWDGTKWSEVGTGLQFYNPGYGTVQPFDMEVHDGKLYVVGAFNFAGNVPARFVATWDGDRWCSMNSSVFSMSSPTFFIGVGFLNDTLFCGFSGRITEGNDSAFYKGIVKAPLNLVSDTCSIDFTTGVEEQNNFENRISVYPNPATNKISITLKNGTVRLKKLELINTNGQIIYSQKMGEQNNPSSTIELNQIAGGVYVLKATTGSGEVFKEIIVIQKY